MVRKCRRGNRRSRLVKHTFQHHSLCRSTLSRLVLTNTFQRRMRRMALLDTVTLVNIVSGTRVVPEFIGARCRPDLIAEAMFEVLNHPQEQAQAMAQTMELLGRDGPPPHLRAAQSVLAALHRPPV